jgi:hypothetical protein
MLSKNVLKGDVSNNLSTILADTISHHGIPRENAADI